MLSLLTAVQDDGLGVSEVIRGIPHDGPAFVVYTLLVLFGVGIWFGSRKKPAK